MSFITLIVLLSLVPSSFPSGFHSSMFFHILPKVPATMTITHLSQDVKHYTRTLEPFQAAILLTVLALTIVFGLVYRSLLLKNVYQLGCLRPIAAMTGIFESNIPFVVKLQYAQTVWDTKNVSKWTSNVQILPSTPSTYLIIYSW